MNRILLTSTALVAFAGAAAAEISYTGNAKVGLNTEKGAFWSAGLKVTAEKELSGGLTAGFTAGLGFKPANAGTASSELGAVQFKDYELYLKSDTAGMYFGDTKTAAGAKWSAGVSGLAEDKFATKISHYTHRGGVNPGAVLRGELNRWGVDMAVSVAVANPTDGTFGRNEVYGAQVAAKYSTGNYNFGFAYQDDSKPIALKADDAARGKRRVGVSAGMTLAGADVGLAYVGNLTDNSRSFGVQVAYPFGPVKVTGYYANNSAAADRYGIKLAYAQDAIKVTAKVDAYSKYGATAAYTKYAVDGSYDFNNGLVMKAGFGGASNSSNRVAYLGGEYDLGGGASLLVSHGYSNKAGYQKDLGAPDYREGSTIQVSFKF